MEKDGVKVVCPCGCVWDLYTTLRAVRELGSRMYVQYLQSIAKAKTATMTSVNRMVYILKKELKENQQGGSAGYRTGHQT